MLYNDLPLGIVICPGAAVFGKNLIADINNRLQIPIDNIEIPTKFTRFANGEVKAEIEQSIRCRDIYIIQDVYSKSPGEYSGNPAGYYSVNDHLMTLKVAVGAVASASAARITCVLPGYPYSRQHKRTGREPLTASDIGYELENMGVSRIATLDIHSKEIENRFTRMHLESFHASYSISKQLVELIDIEQDDWMVVAPDTGAVSRATFFASNFKRPMAILYKERDYSKASKDADSSNIKSMRLIGDVSGKDVFIADDMLDTGGTLINAMYKLKEEGAKKIIIGISLPMFSGNAVEKFNDAYRNQMFYRIVGCNSINQSTDLLGQEWYCQADTTSLFAESIVRMNNGASMSDLFDSSPRIQKLISGIKYRSIHTR